MIKYFFLVDILNNISRGKDSSPICILFTVGKNQRKYPYLYAELRDFYQNMGNFQVDRKMG